MNEAVVPAHSTAMRKNCSSAVAYHPPAHDAWVKPEILSVCLSLVAGGVGVVRSVAEGASEAHRTGAPSRPRPPSPACRRETAGTSSSPARAASRSPEAWEMVVVSGRRAGGTSSCGVVHSSSHIRSPDRRRSVRMPPSGTADRRGRRSAAAALRSYSPRRSPRVPRRIRLRAAGA